MVKFLTKPFQQKSVLWITVQNCENRIGVSKTREDDSFVYAEDNSLVKTEKE